MARVPNWQQVLIECKTNVQLRIRPLLKTLNEQQPDLGVGAGGDRIKQVDLVAENAIIDTLKEHAISFILVSEESGVKEYGENPSDCYVTTDPVDGTTNMTRGIPFYATSIAVSTGPMLKSVHAALVADLFHDTTYYAQKERGASRNDEKITPSNLSSLEESVIGIDINTFKIQELIPRLIDLVQNTKHIRHLGANALELCYVADGTTDAFIDIRGKLRTTDMAAASLIIREAGARITTLEGKPLNAKLDPAQKVSFVAAANQEIHEKVLASLRKV
jgi:myo-inositol-1(or 4)-monophosphatase